mmetsp:Transcript_30509/g.45442  ORF Transcript_30509/g.45442 Transcript_30509/m.45442 type:complete len:234 (-) Transcript_30509:876-1577(-)
MRNNAERSIRSPHAIAQESVGRFNYDTMDEERIRYSPFGNIVTGCFVGKSTRRRIASVNAGNDKENRKEFESTKDQQALRNLDCITTASLSGPTHSINDTCGIVYGSSSSVQNWAVSSHIDGHASEERANEETTSQDQNEPEAVYDSDQGQNNSLNQDSSNDDDSISSESTSDNESMEGDHETRFYVQTGSVSLSLVEMERNLNFPIRGSKKNTDQYDKVILDKITKTPRPGT